MKITSITKKGWKPTGNLRLDLPIMKAIVRAVKILAAMPRRYAE